MFTVYFAHILSQSFSPLILLPEVAQNVHSVINVKVHSRQLKANEILFQTASPLQPSNVTPLLLLNLLMVIAMALVDVLELQ